MTEASSPSLPAIRERAQAWQEEQAAAAARGWRWAGPPEVPGLRAEVAFLLALVADLQERMQVTQAENRRMHDHTEFLEGCLQVETGALARLQGEREEARARQREQVEALQLARDIIRNVMDQHHIYPGPAEFAQIGRVLAAARAALGEE